MFILKILLANIAGLWVSDFLLSGFKVGGSWVGYLIAGVILGILNLLLKPILKLISAPIIILSLGLFTLVINGFILWLASRFIPNYISIGGFLSFLGATIIITVTNLLVRGKA